MIKISYNDAKFNRQMNNLIAYSNGFIDGAIAAKPEMLRILGDEVTEVMGQYIDSLARANPSMLHHVYEWAQTGSSSSRLFDINYIVNSGGLTMNATLTQSQSVKQGSTTPFYDKARIMENGIPVKIEPKNSQVLAFEDNGQQVFTRKPVVVSSPGGEGVEGQFGSTFENFFSVYLSQSILDVTGLGDLKNPTEFKTNLKRGMSSGRSAGLSAGRKWITGSKV